MYNPILLIDPKGNNAKPVYDTKGNFLVTEDKDNKKEYFAINVYGSMSYTYITVSNDGKYFRAVKGKYTNNELAIFLTDYVRLLGIPI